MTKIKAAVRTFCDTAAFLCIAVRIIKYFIRYGIDYYFEKLVEYQKNQKHTED